MKKLALLTIGALVVTAGLGLTPSRSAAQGPEARLYSVKFLCGLQTKLPATPPSEPSVKPGNYATAINIHNFHTFSVVIDKKATIALSERAAPGPISKPARDVLTPNEAIEVDCSEIVKLFDLPLPLPPFIKGFVEIVSSQGPELNVVAVYTAKECETFQPPTVAPLPLPVCRRFGELSLQVVQYRFPFSLP